MTVDVWHIDLAAPDSAFEIDWLDAEERARLRAYRPTAVKRRFARSHAALRAILSSYTQALPSELRFAIGPHGKPDLVDRSVHFNLAHSGEVALVAVSPDVAVGVDVEQMRPLRALLTMARTVFHPEEIAQLQALAPLLRTEAFFECWVRREALVKGLGVGLAAVDSIGPAWRPGVRTVTLQEGWEIQGLAIESPYRAAVAAQTHSFAVRRRAWPVDGLDSPRTG